MENFGKETAQLVESVFARGVSHAVLLLRHSAREYVPERHDLENPLTDDGRHYAKRLGEDLPKQVTLRGYASPPHRCMETAELVLSGHAQAGGTITRHRPLEALGVFYALDQVRMWQGMRVAGGLVPFMQSWFDGAVPVDAMMDPDLASNLLLQVLVGKLLAPVADLQLDVCVSHDMTLYLMRARLLGQALSSRDVAYLDGLILFQQGDELKLAGFAADDLGTEVTVSPGGA